MFWSGRLSSAVISDSACEEAKVLNKMLVRSSSSTLFQLFNKPLPLTRLPSPSKIAIESSRPAIYDILEEGEIHKQQRTQHVRSSKTVVEDEWDDTNGIQEELRSAQ
ncbi:hypothetical protein KIN20_021300 [Parelaphostrongylus tenuis]|uniref:Uncharacterized protein n=1 Tax=Parelaphostrongylus tenuis TaxID=148309 RepID=A0AAD5QU31_PARTN|nr:hypothetical protein KIN20_021300 [Parelaphostrongylus tenuis]